MVDGIFSKQELNGLLQRYKSRIEDMNIPIFKMYLYGSYAKNKPRKWSDVDICIISPVFNDRIDATMMLMKIRKDDELLLSPIAFSPDSFVDDDPLAWEIKQNGIVLN